MTPEETAERLLYITLRVEARDHVGYFGGYSYAMILKNEKLGERPFYENLELAPGKAIEGLVRPARREAGCRGQGPVVLRTQPRPYLQRWPVGGVEDGCRGPLPLDPASEGESCFSGFFHWNTRPETHGLKDARRGDLGTFTLDKGVRFGGRVLDAKGKPVGGVFVAADLEQKRGGDDDAVPQGVADMKHRATLTEADGSFAFRPLPPGTCRVYPNEQGWDPSTREGGPRPEAASTTGGLHAAKGHPQGGRDARPGRDPRRAPRCQGVKL